jgi:hypothetical protein
VLPAPEHGFKVRKNLTPTEIIAKGFHVLYRDSCNYMHPETERIDFEKLFFPLLCVLCRLCG